VPPDSAEHRIGRQAALLYGGWILVNSGLVPGLPRFDPFPFVLLAVASSVEAIFLSTFVLMKQNRMSGREDLRAHLDLQINLLSEREMTLVLQMLQRIRSGWACIFLPGK
jgi:uncharacterized membrane protein